MEHITRRAIRYRSRATRAGSEQGAPPEGAPEPGGDEENQALIDSQAAGAGKADDNVAEAGGGGAASSGTGRLRSNTVAVKGGKSNEA